MTRRMRAGLATALATYLVLVLVATITPGSEANPIARDVSDAISSARDRGAPSVFTWRSVEQVANIVLFVPIGALGTLLAPPRRWWLVGLAGALFSVAIEWSQHALVPGRDASARDIVINSLGALGGAAAVAAFRWRADRRASRARGSTPD